MIKKTFVKNIKQNFGIGNGKTKNILEHCGLNSRLSLKYIKKKHLEEVETLKSNLNIEKRFKSTIKSYINFLVEHRTYKGMRHKLKYPVRGQRTRTNAKTAKKKVL